MHEQLVTVDRQKEEVSPPSSPTTPTPGILKKPQASPRSRDQGGVNKSCKLHTSQKKHKRTGCWVINSHGTIFNSFFFGGWFCSQKFFAASLKK